MKSWHPQMFPLGCTSSIKKKVITYLTCKSETLRSFLNNITVLRLEKGILQKPESSFANKHKKLSFAVACLEYKLGSEIKKIVITFYKLAYIWLLQMN